MGWGSVVGSLVSSAGNYFSAERAWKHQKEYAQNAHQWEVEDLKKAGLNPILSAGGSGAPMSSAPQAHFENPLAGYSSYKLQKKALDTDIDVKNSAKDANEANANEANAKAESISFQTGLEKELAEEKKKQAMWQTKTAEQNYLNAKEMPKVYQSQAYYHNSAGRFHEVGSRRGEAEMPAWQTAGEVINSATDYLKNIDFDELYDKGKKAWDDFWKDDEKPKPKEDHSKRSGFLKHLDEGGSVASYAKYKDRS